MPDLRIVFAGTPSAAVPSLRRLADGPHEVAAVVTRPPAPIGRKRVLTPSPVAATAAELGLPVLEASRLDAEASGRIAALRADLGVIVAYGGLVREPLLSTPRLGWINLHFSLLPAWRGAAPVQRAIIAGDAETGAAVFRLVAELDAGDVYAEVRHPIAPDRTAGDLLDELSAVGADLLADVVDALADGSAVATPQRGAPTFAPKLALEDGRLDFGRTTSEVDARRRGVTPEPGAFTEVGGVRLKVLDAVPAEPVAGIDPGHVVRHGRRILVGTSDGALELRRVHPAGRSAMEADAWWRGLGVDEAVAR